MTPEDRLNITYQRQRYRSKESELEITLYQVDSILEEEEKGKAPMAEQREDGKEFASLLLKSM